MRCLRCTMWIDPEHPEPIVFFRESDVKDWDDTIAAMKRPTKDRLNTMEVFEMVGEPDMTQVVMHGMRRWQKVRPIEQNMAVLFYWIGGFSKRLAPHGIIATPRPAPFDADRVEAVLWQLSLCPGYNPTHSMIVPSQDGTLLTLHDGKVVRQTDPLKGQREPSKP